MLEPTKRLKEFSERIINVLHDENVEPQSSNVKKVIAVIDGLEFYCVREAAQSLGVTKATLVRKLKADNVFDTRRERIKGQIKPMFYKDKLYLSPSHLLQGNVELILGVDIVKMVKLLNQKSRRARGETYGMSLGDVSTTLGIDTPQYADEFDAWADMVRELVGNAGMFEMFYDYKPIYHKMYCYETGVYKVYYRDESYCY